MIIPQLLTTIPTQVIPSIPTLAGTAYGGGYYAGRIKIGTSTYALVVSPRASGYGTGLQWKTSVFNATVSNLFNDGFTNSQEMNKAGFPAAQFCRALSIGGYTDWYMPSWAELEICYRNLKPTTTGNTVNSTQFNTARANGAYVPPGVISIGENPYSSPVGAGYTTFSPLQTTAALFKVGQSEAFYGNQWLWTSNKYDTQYCWFQSFENGSQSGVTGDYAGYVRAVRKVLIS